MTQAEINKLTLDQEALIPVYREKWREIAFSTERINRKEASAAVKATYTFSGLSEPESLFFDSPYAAWSYIFKEKPIHWGGGCRHIIHHGLESNVGNIGWDKIQPWSSLDKHLWYALVDLLQADVGEVTNAIEKQIESQLNRVGQPQLVNSSKLMILPHEWACRSCWIDFCISVLDCDCEPWDWIAYRSVAKHCGWISPITQVCVICDRPTKLSFDNKGRLHDSGEPAIQFADRFSVYAHHGEVLPAQ